MTIGFNELADYLKQGREIEFRYNDKDYSITNRHSEWHFCCDTDRTSVALCSFYEFDILVDRIKEAEIDDVSIEKIFNENLGNITIWAVL